jgi:hypothetical protein
MSFDISGGLGKQQEIELLMWAIRGAGEKRGLKSEQTNSYNVIRGICLRYEIWPRSGRLGHRAS